MKFWSVYLWSVSFFFPYFTLSKKQFPDLLNLNILIFKSYKIQQCGTEHLQTKWNAVYIHTF